MKNSKTNNMDTIKEVKELIARDTMAHHQLYAIFELIIVVDKNFKHIAQLEALINVLRAAKNGDLLSSFAYIIAENTRANHYRAGLEKFDDVYVVCQELFPNMTLFQEHKAIEKANIELAKPIPTLFGS